MPVAFGTASVMLFDAGRLRSGETVLVRGATGGVGVAAVQLAAVAGATVIATASDEDRATALRRQNRAARQHEAGHERARRFWPAQPDWAAELGTGAGRPPIEVHAGHRYMIGTRRQPISRDKGRRLLADGVRACSRCPRHRTGDPVTEPPGFVPEGVPNCRPERRPHEFI